MYLWGNEKPETTRLSFEEGAPFEPDTSCHITAYPINDGYYGVCGLVGNVHERVSGWYYPYYHKESPAENPKGPDSDSEHV